MLRGDGLFESLRVVDGRAEFLDDHLARLERSAVLMDLPSPPAREWRRIVDAAAATWAGGPEFAVRLVLTRGTGRAGASWYVLADPVGQDVVARRQEGVSALTLERGLEPGAAERAPWLLASLKSLSYAVNMAARRWARAHGADDAIFVSPDGTVLEGTTSAVVIARGPELISPPRSLGILPSITVDQLFHSAPAAGWTVGFERLTVADLRDADGVWLLSSVVKAARVHTIDGTTLADSGLHGQLCRLTGLPSPPG